MISTNEDGMVLCKTCNGAKLTANQPTHYSRVAPEGAVKRYVGLTFECRHCHEKHEMLFINKNGGTRIAWREKLPTVEPDDKALDGLRQMLKHGAA